VTAIERKDLTLSDITELLHAEIFSGEDKLNIPVEAGTASDLMSDMLTGETSGAVLLTGLCNVQVIHTAVIADVAAVMLVRGKRPTQEMILQARENRLPLFSTPFTMFTSCGRLCAKGLRGVEEKAPAPAVPSDGR
jgi:predicted transcriptional regulator